MFFTSLVPQIKESKIHPFLKFPKGREEKAKSVASDDQKDVQQIQDTSANLQKDSHVQQEAQAHQNVKILDKAKEKTQTFFKNTFSGILTLKEKEGAHDVHSSLRQNPSDGKTQNENTQKSLDQNMATAQNQQKAHSLTKDDNIPSIQKETTVKASFKKMDKDNINIDENTQNDLAPMAIKSSVSQRDDSEPPSNIELSEKDILRVLNKYKDTLEFQEIVENVLSEYAKTTVTNILQENKVTDLLKQPLTEFKESQKFKELVEQQIIGYVQKHLPLLIKDIVEQEIKKIIGN